MSGSQNPINPVYQLNTVMGFGRYRDETVRTVIRIDPNYVLWAQENVKWFVLDAEAESILESSIESSDSDYTDDIPF